MKLLDEMNKKRKAKVEEQESLMKKTLVKKSSTPARKEAKKAKKVPKKAEDEAKEEKKEGIKKEKQEEQESLKKILVKESSTPARKEAKKAKKVPKKAEDEAKEEKKEGIKKEQQEGIKKTEAEARKEMIKKLLGKKEQGRKTQDPGQAAVAKDVTRPETVEKVDVKEDKKTVEEDEKKKTPQETPKKLGFRAKLQMFRRVEKQERTYEDWKKEKELERISKKRKMEQVDCEKGKEMDMKKSKISSSSKEGLKLKNNIAINTPCYSKSDDQQVQGVQGVALEGGGGAVSSDIIANTAEQRARVGCGKNFLPEITAAAAGVVTDSSGGKQHCTHVQP